MGKPLRSERAAIFLQVFQQFDRREKVVKIMLCFNEAMRSFTTRAPSCFSLHVIGAVCQDPNLEFLVYLGGRSTLKLYYCLVYCNFHGLSCMQQNSALLKSNRVRSSMQLVSSGIARLSFNNFQSMGVSRKCRIPCKPLAQQWSIYHVVVGSSFAQCIDLSRLLCCLAYRFVSATMLSVVKKCWRT